MTARKAKHRPTLNSERASGGCSIEWSSEFGVDTIFSVFGILVWANDFKLVYVMLWLIGRYGFILDTIVYVSVVAKLVILNASSFSLIEWKINITCKKRYSEI